MDLKMTDKKLEVVFAPGCFDDFEGTQEELDAFVSEINRLIDSGELLEHAEEFNIDELMVYKDEDQFEALTSGSNTRVLQ
jgi:hypothetical protein